MSWHRTRVLRAGVGRNQGKNVARVVVALLGACGPRVKKKNFRVGPAPFVQPAVRESLHVQPRRPCSKKEKYLYLGPVQPRTKTIPSRPVEENKTTVPSRREENYLPSRPAEEKKNTIPSRRREK